MGTPHRGTPDFWWAPVLLDIYNTSQYDPCAFCGLKGGCDRKKKKKKKIRKIFIQSEINMTMTKVVSSMSKKHKLFFINVDSYQGTPV